MTATASPPLPMTSTQEPAIEETAFDIFRGYVSKAEAAAAKLAGIGDFTAEAERDALVSKIEGLDDDAAAEKLAAQLSKVDNRLRVRDIRVLKFQREFEEAEQAALNMLPPAISDVCRDIHEAEITINQLIETSRFSESACRPEKVDKVGRAVLDTGESDRIEVAKAARDFIYALPTFVKLEQLPRDLRSFRHLDNASEILSQLVSARDAMQEALDGLHALTATAASAIEALNSTVETITTK